MEQHVHTVESVAACFFCSAQKQGFPGVVDDVPHYQTRMEEGRIGNQRSIRAGGHAYRGGVDEDVGLVQTFFQRYFIRQIKKPDVAVAFSMNAFYLLSNKLRGGGSAPGEDVDGGSAVQGRLGQNGCRRSAAAKQDRVLSLTGEARVPHGLQKAIAVGIVAKELSVPVYDGIDCAA